MQHSHQDPQDPISRAIWGPQKCGLYPSVERRRTQKSESVQQETSAQRGRGSRHRGVRGASGLTAPFLTWQLPRRRRSGGATSRAAPSSTSTTASKGDVASWWPSRRRRACKWGAPAAGAGGGCATARAGACGDREAEPPSLGRVPFPRPGRPPQPLPRALGPFGRLLRERLGTLSS